MRCSVVFGVTLRLLVINISSSSPAINIAAYYQRCVTTCRGQLATVLTTPACCIVNSIAVKKPESRLLPTPLAFDAPFRGFPSEYCYTVWHGKN